jgi:Immunity protein Imm1
MPRSGAGNDDTPSTIVTASLTTGVARVAHGMAACKQLVDEILQTEHVDWETTLAVGDVEFHHTKAGPFPNHQLRVSVQPATGYAALNYTDHDDPDLPIANSFNPRRPLPEIRLIFSGATGRVFPRAAAIPIVDARRAVIEWLTTRKRPTCIDWRPFDAY